MVKGIEEALEEGEALYGVLHLHLVTVDIIFDAPVLGSHHALVDGKEGPAGPGITIEGVSDSPRVDEPYPFAVEVRRHMGVGAKDDVDLLAGQFL